MGVADRENGMYTQYSPRIRNATCPHNKTSINGYSPHFIEYSETCSHEAVLEEHMTCQECRKVAHILAMRRRKTITSSDVF